MKGLIKQVLVNIKDFFTLKTIDEVEVLYQFTNPRLDKLGLDWFNGVVHMPDKKFYLKTLGFRESASVNKVHTENMYGDFYSDTLRSAISYSNSKLAIFEHDKDDREMLTVDYLKSMLVIIKEDLINTATQGCAVDEYRIHLSFTSKPIESWLTPHVYEDIFSGSDLEVVMSEVTAFLRRYPFQFDITNKLFDREYESTLNIYIPYINKDSKQWTEFTHYNHELVINKVY